MASVKQYHPLTTWLVILCSPLLATAAEYTILANFKDSQRLDKGLGSAEFINTNGVPNHINSIGSTQQFASSSLQSTSGITTSYGIMPEERAVLDTFTMATVNHTYYDLMGELFRLMGENNAKFGEGKVFPVHGRLVHVTSAKDPTDHSACHPNIRDSAGHRCEPLDGLLVHRFLYSMCCSLQVARGRRALDCTDPTRCLQVRGQSEECLQLQRGWSYRVQRQGLTEPGQDADSG